MSIIDVYYKIEQKLIEFTVPLSNYVNKVFDIHWIPNYYLHAIFGLAIGIISSVTSYTITKNAFWSSIVASLITFLIAGLKEYFDGITGKGSVSWTSFYITAIFGVIGGLIIFIKK